MPEDAEGEATLRVLEGFDGAVGGARGFVQATAERSEALVVMRLHVVAVAEDRCEPGLGEHLDVVLGEDARRLLVDVRPDTVGYVLLQVAAERDVQHLRAAADREYRQVVR